MITQFKGINKVLKEQKEPPHLLIKWKKSGNEERDKNRTQTDFSPLIRIILSSKEHFLFPLFSRFHLEKKLPPLAFESLQFCQTTHDWMNGSI